MNSNVTGIHKVYHIDTNNILEEVFILNGIREGICKRYYKCGCLMALCNYVNGKLNGEYKTFYNTCKKYNNEGNNISCICYYIDDKKNGLYQTFYNTGQKWKIINYIDGEIVGEYKSYARNGNLQLQ